MSENGKTANGAPTPLNTEAAVLKLKTPQEFKAEVAKLRELKREDLFKSLLLGLVVVGIVVGLLWAGHLTIGLILFVVYSLSGGAVG